MNVSAELAQMKRQTVDQLRERYAELFGEPTRNRHRVWLTRRIIWRLQALAEGDLSERARLRASELANDADLRVTAPRAAKTVRVMAPNDPASKQSDQRLPPAGSLLVRRYKGQHLQVEVLNDGFRYAGEQYASLSAVAKAITGSHTNGFLFFRLTGGQA